MLGIAPDLPDPLVGVRGVRNGGLDHAWRRPPTPDGRSGPPPAAGGSSTASRSIPHTSFWCWSQAPLPTRTGRESRQPDRWSRVRSVRSLRAVDAVHDLQVDQSWSSPGDRLEHEGEVLERLPLEPQPVERAQHEGGVADPRVAVVPVARPAGRLGQRGRRRRHDGAGRRVAQTLERQGAALDVAAPRMVGEGAVGQPVPPVGDGGVELRSGPLRCSPDGRPPHDRATKADSPFSSVVRP